MATVLPLTFIHMKKMKRNILFITKGKLYEISKNIKSFVNEVNINKITEFMKNNKIIVKDTNSVRKLVEFLASIQ